MSEKQLIKTLNRLHRICVAGERGFNAVAENLNNRGLKVLLKKYAQQRYRFANELQVMIEDIGGTVSQRRSIRGIVHRGRIDIFSTLTIGQLNVERVALKEALVGEKAALRAYKKAIEKADLPAEISATLSQQYETIQATRQQIEKLISRSGECTIVSLFDDDQDMSKAAKQLKLAGFPEEAINTLTLNEASDRYKGKGSTIDETVISGAVGGALWTSLMGAISGLLMVLTPGIGATETLSAQSIFALVTLGGALVGAVFGAILGFLISVAIHEEDGYLYNRSLKDGNKLMILQTNKQRAPEATQIMHSVEILYSAQ
jgi:uncharacterized protein (TIGR02284 family)